MSGARGGASIRAAVRVRHAEEGVVSEMARSLHRDAESERECAGESVRRREVVCATEAAHRVRPPRALATRPRRAAVIA
jgi:hypothetical protein